MAAGKPRHPTAVLLEQTRRKSLIELEQYVRIAEARGWEEAPALREEYRRRVAERAAEAKAEREAAEREAARLTTAELEKRAAQPGAHSAFRTALRRRQEATAGQPPLQPCVACGRPTRRRWCSRGCYVADEGPPEPGERW